MEPKVAMLRKLLLLLIYFAHLNSASGAAWHLGEGKVFSARSIRNSYFKQDISIAGTSNYNQLGQSWSRDWGFASQTHYSSEEASEYRAYGLPNDYNFYWEAMNGHRKEIGLLQATNGERRRSLFAQLNYPIASLKLGLTRQVYKENNKVLSLGTEFYSSEYALIKKGYKGDGLNYIALNIFTGIGAHDSYVEQQWGLRKYPKAVGLTPEHRLKYGKTFCPIFFTELELYNLVHYPYLKQSRLLQNFIKYYGDDFPELKDLTPLAKQLRYDSYHQISISSGIKHSNNQALVVSIHKPIGAIKGKVSYSLAWQKWL